MLKVGFAFALLCAVVPRVAQADLYRWVDPETGSVKFSNFPPAEGRSSDIVPFRGAAPVPERPAPKADPKAQATAPLEERRHLLQQALVQTRVNPANRGALEKQVEAYQAASRELDQLDPAGIERRRAEDAALFERMRAGLGAQAVPAGEPAKGTE